MGGIKPPFHPYKGRVLSLNDIGLVLLGRIELPFARYEGAGLPLT